MDRDIEKQSADLLVYLLNNQADISADNRILAKRIDDYSTLDPGITIEVDIMSSPVTGHIDYQLLWLIGMITVTAPVASDPEALKVNNVVGYVRNAIYDAADLRGSLSDGYVYCFPNSIRVTSYDVLDDEEYYNRLFVLRWAADQQPER